MKTVRITLEMSQDVADKLDEMTRSSRSIHRVDTIRNALAHYQSLLEHKAKGGKVVLEHSNGDKQELVVE